MIQNIGSDCSKVFDTDDSMNNTNDEGTMSEYSACASEVFDSDAITMNNITDEETMSKYCTSMYTSLYCNIYMPEFL